MRIHWIWALNIFLLAAPALADSDGYYCVGRDYVAYQFGLSAPPVAPHRLYVVRFGGSEHIAEPAVIELPQFQVHGILCHADTVEIMAWDRIYTISLDPSRRPIRYFADSWGDPGKIPPRFVGQSRNLGSWSEANTKLTTERHRLGTDSLGHEFVLQISSEVARLGRCETDMIGRIIEFDNSGQPIHERRLFQSRGILWVCP